MKTPEIGTKATVDGKAYEVVLINRLETRVALAPVDGDGGEVEFSLRQDGQWRQVNKRGGATATFE